MQIEVEKESASAEGAVVTCLKLDSYPVSTRLPLVVHCTLSWRLSTTVNCR